MTFSEFGRRVAENHSAGTDHGTASVMFLAGGAVAPGLRGARPDLTKLDESGDLVHTVDFRAVYAAVLGNWFGADADHVLTGRFRPAPILRVAKLNSSQIAQVATHTNPTCQRGHVRFCLRLRLQPSLALRVSVALPVRRSGDQHGESEFSMNLLKEEAAVSRFIVRIRKVDSGVIADETTPGLSAAWTSHAMTQIADRTMVARPVRWGSRIPRGRLLALLVLGLSEMTAEASPIKHHAVSNKSSSGVQIWDEFIAKGPSSWARVHPPKMSAQTSQTMHEVWREEFKSADAVSYPNIQYLLWRRALDPARFDHWHPGMGKALESLLPVPSSAPTLTLGSTPQTQPLLPTTSSTTTSPSNVLPSSVVPETVIPPSGGNPSPASIPEPDTLTLAAVLFASELLRRLSTRRSRA
jgi:hypothetical protein